MDPRPGRAAGGTRGPPRLRGGLRRGLGAPLRALSLDVTRAAGRSWRLATGRRARWVLPDWVRVALEYDAVHLQPGAYLAAAGTAIEVGGGAASVIGGWDPHVTYWFHPRVCYSGAAERWEWAERAGEGGWGQVPGAKR